MPPDSSPPGPIRKFFKRVAHGAKKVLKPSAQAPNARVPSPPPGGPSPQPTLSAESDYILPPQTPARSQHPSASPQPAPSSNQPPLTSLPFATTGNQPANVESSLTAAVKKAGADAWSGLKVALQLLETSAGVFPPVKSAVAEFLGVVDIFEKAAQNRKDYAELASNLQGIVDEFKEHPGEQTSSKMSEALTVMASELKKEMQHAEHQQQRSGVRRHVEARKDVQDVQECYRRVETLCHELQNKALIRIWRNQEQQLADSSLKELNAALRAMHDSTLADVVGRRTCTPGTRTAILAEMRKWADDPKGPKVYWMNGMAGTGKTTLAYSFCDQMQLERRLGASFFCSRVDADSRDVSRIVPTIAHQLARLLPLYREVLVRKVDEDKEIGARRTATQFEKLIRDPLREVTASVPEGVVVTIDALDECERRDGVQDILNVLFLYARDLPIKFLVTCRPEPGLFDTLQSKDEHYRSVLHLHDIKASFVQADITLYLEEELSSLALPREQLGRLAEQAAMLFIYAATVVRYIYPKGQPVNSRRRLEDVLSIGSQSDTNKNNAINDLYTAVLAAPFAAEHLNREEKENIRLVLDTVVCAKEPMSVTTMTKLLGLEDEQDTVYALQHLRSVLHVSEGTGLIYTFHASFPDFILSRERSKQLCCAAEEHNRHLALRCFSTMERLLRFNICGLESSFLLDENVPDLKQKIERAISPELFYACRYWGSHLESTTALDDMQATLEEFLSSRLLFWMEVLNLRDNVGAGAQMLTQVHRWLQRLDGTNSVVELALDASKFVSAFGLSSASRSTPHIYVSALPFWQETRPVRVRYWTRVQGMIRLKGSGIERRDMSCLAAWDTGSTVYCTASSPDGTRIVSSSQDYTIRVWDASSGDLVAGPFEGHTGSVSSVSFSPDGTRIASGSLDNTIRVWDASSGDLVAGPFNGRTGCVRSVSFSPDGTHIVSGSDDNTVRVWDANFGDLVVGPFDGHTELVASVAFSPDGTHIVSGSWDKTIRVWDASNGNLVVGPLQGHTKSVTSVAFSLDGTRIVSGSADDTIRVWDARCGDLIAGPFQGHAHNVNSVAFSPDGTHIASGSGDKIIRVWDVNSGNLVGEPFQGHTESVTSVAFSLDGTRIVSGSVDNTIRVWDASRRDLVARPSQGHTNWVHSVAFSPSSAHIVSGSRDKTIHVWDAHSGDPVVGPLQGHTEPVTAVSFSPDGAHIVSGSEDKTIRVWDAHSGDLVAGPFEGHTEPVTTVSFSPNGTRIASGSGDNAIRLWDANSGDLAAGPFEGHTNWVTSVSFSSDGTRIASGSDDKTIRVWDAHSGDLVAGPFKGHTGEITCVSFSPNGTRIVSSSGDWTIRVWDASSGDLVARPSRGHTHWVTCVSFSPDGTHIVSGSADDTICVWDANSGDLVAGPFQGHTDDVDSVSFSPDGTRIVSGAYDRTIRVWDASALYAHDRGHLKDWLMDKIGMITTRRGQLLLCVPPDLLNGLVRPENTAVIYARGMLRLNFDDVLLGNKWTQCYRC